MKRSPNYLRALFITTDYRAHRRAKYRVPVESTKYSVGNATPDTRSRHALTKWI